MSYRSGSSHNGKVRATLWSGLELSRGLTGSHYTAAKDVAPSGLQWSSSRCWYGRACWNSRSYRISQYDQNIDESLWALHCKFIFYTPTPDWSFEPPISLNLVYLSFHAIFLPSNLFHFSKIWEHFTFLCFKPPPYSPESSFHSYIQTHNTSSCTVREVDGQKTDFTKQLW